MEDTHENVPVHTLNRSRHAAHSQRCLMAMPGSASGLQLDFQKAALAFYCLGSQDLLGTLDKVSNETRQECREGLWSLYTQSPQGDGFRGGSAMSLHPSIESVLSGYDSPHVIMTYAALLSLAILRDECSLLNRERVISLLRSCQQDDGSFSTTSGSSEADLRSTYCAFAISSMLGDWSGLDLPRAVGFIQRCRTYEGGYGQQPGQEAIGGTTYCALAALDLAASGSSSTTSYQLREKERIQTIRWLLQQQSQTEGGFSGRTNKDADACYCFWNGAALHLLGAGHLVHASALAQFLSACQHTYGGIAKAPEETSDPYHTYLSLAAIALFPPPSDTGLFDETWKVQPLDAALLASQASTAWARSRLSPLPGP